MAREWNPLILQLYARTPAPCRDYCGLSITKEELVLNIWNVTYGPHVYPQRQTCSLEHFENDKYMQAEVLRLFGDFVVKYVVSISKGEIRLENLQSSLFLKIINFLAARDILNLSQTSKVLFELCNTETVWKLLFDKYFKIQLEGKDLLIAESLGWKTTIKDMVAKKAKESNKFQSISSGTAISKIAPHTIGLGYNANKHIANKNIKKIPVQIKEIKKEIKNNTLTYPNTNRKEINKLRPKVDSAKSSFDLNVNMNPITGQIIKPIKSVATMNNSTKNNFIRQKPKSDMKGNNLKTLKNTNIKIQIPKDLQASIDFLKKSNAIKEKYYMPRPREIKAETIKLEVPIFRKNNTSSKK